MKIEVDEVPQEDMPQTVTLDKKDRRILELLQENSSQSLTDTTKKVNISIPTVPDILPPLKQWGSTLLPKEIWDVSPPC